MVKSLDLAVQYFRLKVFKQHSSIFQTLHESFIAILLSKLQKFFSFSKNTVFLKIVFTVLCGVRSVIAVIIVKYCIIVLLNQIVQQYF